MKLEGERWRTLVSTVRLGRDEYRVVRPAWPVMHALMFDSYCGVQLVVDKAAARTVAMAWEFAMRSPRTLVYLPLRRNASECEEYGGEALLNLVLLHHSLGFPASRWKEVRARLGPGRPHTVVSRGLPSLDDVRDEPYEAYYQGYKDDLRHDVAADTLFIVTSISSPVTASNTKPPRS